MFPESTFLSTAVSEIFVVTTVFLIYSFRFPKTIKWISPRCFDLLCSAAIYKPLYFILSYIFCRYTLVTLFLTLPYPRSTQHQLMPNSTTFDAVLLHSVHPFIAWCGRKSKFAFLLKKYVWKFAFWTATSFLLFYTMMVKLIQNLVACEQTANHKYLMIFALV